MHQQTSGAEIELFRREKLAEDALPPSVYENECSQFYIPNGFTFPIDYMYYGNTANRADTGAYGSAHDYYDGMMVTRPSGTAAITSYNIYTNQVGGLDPTLSSNIRGSAYAAFLHPANKKTALVAEPPWGGAGITNDTSHYGLQPPATPEQTSAMYFGSLANGVGAFTFAQATDFDNYPGAASLGLFCPVPINCDTIGCCPCWTDGLFDHGYNWGHHRIKQYNQIPANDTDHSGNLINLDTLPHPFYLGFSNTYRANLRALKRINAIYDTVNGNPFPFKRWTWMDAYSRHRIQPSLVAIDTFRIQDSTTYNAAFLKVTQTGQVNAWRRTGHDSAYIDLNQFDSTNKTFVEVGLFKDSIGPGNVKYAAIVDNTRTFPSLRDSVDIHYYNDGLDSASQCHSTLGDIDTRKVFIKIDTLQFPAVFRSEYYVLHDIEHPDTSWLVCSDSNFAIYLKPGDAKFLYIEKADAIYAIAADSANQPLTTNWYNNGHHVAERMGGSRQVVVFAEGQDSGKLHVSLPARGSTFTGYNQRSDADNLASGPEITPYLDANGNHIYGIFDTEICVHPSATSSSNDTAVALVYSLANGNIKIAMHPHPDSAWRFAIDTMIATPGSAPVVTPLSGNQWFVAVGIPALISGHAFIKGFRFTANPGSAIVINDTVPFTIVERTDTPITNVSISSRPNFQSGYPVRLTYNWENVIYYWQIGFSGGSLLLDKNSIVSAGLRSCININPQIAALSYQTTVVTSLMARIGNIDDDVIVWDCGRPAELDDATPAQYYSVMRMREDSTGRWTPYYIFRPAGLSGDHRPTIATGQYHWTYNLMTYGFHFFPLPDSLLSPDSDEFRIAYKNNTANTEVVGEANGNWTKSLLSDVSSFPSTPLRTDSIAWMQANPPTYFPPLSLNPLVFDNHLFSTGILPQPAQVFTTNANLPSIRKQLAPAVQFLIIQTADTGECPTTSIQIHMRDVIIPTDPTHPVVSVATPSPVTQGLIDPWPNSPVKGESLTEPFIYHGGDTIEVARQISILDTGYIFSQFHHVGDYVQLNITLVRNSDTSDVLTLDSVVFLRLPNGLGYKDTVIAPGYVVDSTFLVYIVPLGTPTDTGMISVELSHSPLVTTLDRSIIYYLSDTTGTYGALKKGVPPVALPVSFTMTIHPNPARALSLIAIANAPKLRMKLELYDILGKPIQLLYDDVPNSTSLNFALDATRLAEGSYFIRATSGSQVLTRRVEVLK